jgi:UDP-glucuronate 4-epimerase
MRVLITGVAGFIGYHLAARLLAEGHEITGLDNLSSYYDVGLKKARLHELKSRFGFDAAIFDITDRDSLDRMFVGARPDVVVHLAAQAGVRYSLTNPEAYVASNLVGFANMLEVCRKYPPRHLLYASSSSVYGNAARLPLSESDPTDRPLSIYAATKKANEAMAHSYSHLFALPATGLRFFTVYGEWGRPDMAFFSFARDMLSNQPITVYNGGKMSRDFTYVGDAVESVARLMDRPPVASEGRAPSGIVNIASGRRVPILDFIAALESALGKTAEKRYAEMQPGDVTETWADTAKLTALTGFAPQTRIDQGIARFADWYKSWHRPAC